ncbi:flavin reductase family protein [Gemmatimonadota bacterium]
MKRSLGARTIAYPTPVFIVGSYDSEGNPNLMAVAWGGICCSKPPSVAISLRAATYSHSCIRVSGAFTINIPSEDLVGAADYVGTFSGRDVDKFAELGLTPVRSELVNAPFVEEFPVVLECRLNHTVEIGMHTQYVGEILDVKVDEAVIGEQGVPDIELLKPIFYDPGTRGYYGSSSILGKAYTAKRPGKERE